MITRVLSNAGAPLVKPDGTLLANVQVSFLLVNSTGVPCSVFDALTGERVTGRVTTTTNAQGIFSIPLWPNDRGEVASQYTCIIDSYGATPFSAGVPSGSQTLTWLQFKTSGLPITPQVVTAITAYITQLEADVALTHADVVLTHADVVLTHADVALTHADVALTHADVVLTHADVITAGTNAGTATTQAGTATTQAGIASSAALTATNAAAALDAALASFRSKYLGSFTTDPTLDGNGNALVSGAEYFNSVSTKLRFYSGTAWVDYDATAQVEMSNAALSAIAAAGSASAAGTWATAAAASLVAATTQAALATTNGQAQVTLATTQSNNAGTFASAASSSAATALQAAGTATQYSTALAAIASQTAIVPAATVTGFNGTVVASYIYDTRTESDGGAWRKRCQNTSWYNETVYGKYLGEWKDEATARTIGNSVYGPELVVNGQFNSDVSSWFAQTGNPVYGSTIAYSNGTLQVTPNGTFGIAYQTLSGLVSGNVYRVSAQSVPGARFDISLNPGYPNGNAFFSSTTNSAGIVEGYFVASSAPTYVALFSLVSTTTSWDNISVKQVTAQNATTTDYFHNTTDGKFYALKATSGVTEVFRGNRREFPEVVAITAEAGRVIIWDLTDSSRPMWRSFPPNVGVFASIGVGSYLLTSISAIHGQMFIGVGGAAGSGIFIANFILDRFNIYSSAGYYGGAPGTIGGSQLAQSPTIKISNVSLINNIVNSIAATVLPNAPIDPATGLPIPTIYVGTAGGVSRIADDGTVSSTASQNVQKVVIDGIFVKASSGANNAVASWLLTDALPTGSGATYINNAGWNKATYYSTSGSIPAILGANGQAVRGVIGAYTGLALLKENPTTPASGLIANVTSTYSTGWMNGDIRGAWLADMVSETVSGASNTIVNAVDSAFTGAGNWSTQAGVTVAGNAMNFSTVLVTGGIYLAPIFSGLVAGKQYTLTYTVSSYTSGSVQFFNQGQTSSTTPRSSAGTFTEKFIAGSLGYLYIGTAATTATLSITNIIINPAVDDRSVKANPLTVVGTLTKSPVNTGSQLVAYSGFRRNQLYLSQDFSSTWGWSNTSIVVTSNVIADPLGNLTASKLVESNLTSSFCIANINTNLSAQSIPAGYITFSVHLKAAERNWAQIGIYAPTIGINGWVNVDCLNGVIGLGFGTASTTTVTSLAAGWFRFSITLANTASATGMSNTGPRIYIDNSNSGIANHSYLGDGISGLYAWGSQLELGNVATPYERIDYSGVLSSNYLTQPYSANIDFSGDFIIGGWFDLRMAQLNNVFNETLFSRGPSTLSGNGFALLHKAANIWLGRSIAGAAYSYTSFVYSASGLTNLWIVKRSNVIYLYANGAQVATTITDTNSYINAAAVLNIGCHVDLSGCTSARIALFRASATAPSADQIAYMYETERKLFETNAQCCIAGTSTAVTAMDYDSQTDLLHVGTSWGVTEFQGLKAVNSYAQAGVTAISAKSGYELISGTAGSSFYKPSRLLAEELTRTYEQRKAFGSTLIKKQFTATSGQTTFELGIGETPVMVYQQGLLKNEEAGAGYYSITDTGFRKAVVLGTAVTLNDRVTIFYTKG